jgi:hypothetical protein
MLSTQMTETPLISAIKVPNNRRPPILPRYFPNTFMVVENLVFTFMEKLCDSYKGGFWEFYELSNGGFYMAPQDNELREIAVPFGNDFEGKMSSDAVGITVCLFVYGFMAEQHPAASFDDRYWDLRNFAYEHAEANVILQAID